MSILSLISFYVVGGLIAVAMTIVSLKKSEEILTKVGFDQIDANIILFLIFITSWYAIVKVIISKFKREDMTDDEIMEILEETKRNIDLFRAILGI